MLIGRNITILLYDKNIKQQDLAREAGVSPQMMSRIIKGDKVPSLPKLVAIAKALDVSLDDLVCKNCGE
ncbi:MAG: helix-turn-helix transcriptional regulator [Clostridia bacterium]|nr:helix-turn-helix transcriptional regulator [Clostridia bacterium]